MKNYNFIKIKKKIRPENHYNKVGLDNVSRLFLIAIRENITHQNRREKFRIWNGYEPHY